MQRRRRLVRGRSTAALAAALGLVVSLLSACTWKSDEPGLFNGPEQSQVPTPAQPTSTPTSVVGERNPTLPTFGTADWTTGDGTDQPVRIAVHAVRRIAGGATVLDWSVTPLATRTHPMGSAVSPGTDLGLARLGEGNLNVFLIDSARKRLYRPLTATEGSELQHCLCTPIWIAQRQLTVGATTLLQATYPALPADLRAVDVDILTVPIFSQVPVTPVDHAPRAPEVPLIGPAEAPPSDENSRPFPFYDQRLKVSVDGVYAARHMTSIQWRVTALSDGRGLNNATTWPLSETPTRFEYSNPTADGADLRAARGRPTLKALGATTTIRGLGQLECLCTDLRQWTSGGLIKGGTAITAVTNVAALPARTEVVDVGFPGLSPIRDVPVTAVEDTDEFLMGIVSTEPKTYTYRMSDPPAGWSVDAWPTPVPNARQLLGYTRTVDQLR